MYFCSLHFHYFLWGPVLIHLNVLHFTICTVTCTSQYIHFVIHVHSGYFQCFTMMLLGVPLSIPSYAYLSVIEGMHKDVHIFNFTRNCQTDLQSIWEFPYILTKPWYGQRLCFSILGKIIAGIDSVCIAWYIMSLRISSVYQSFGVFICKIPFLYPMFIFLLDFLKFLYIFWLLIFEIYAASFFSWSFCFF